ncbi:MAG TPA: hypothetical protein VEC19_11585 [Usitatibacter sp.]|nr:hypothetical protein [Usitatibacter sp.]
MDQTLGSSSRDVLDPPIPGGRSLTTPERQAIDLSTTIKGWGSDLDPARRPGVPRDKAPQLGREDLYPAIEPQVSRTKIHKSTEHGKLPPVFGTSCPPRGLSGVLRDVAYKFSEGRLARWLTLMFADRVDVVEGVVEDLAHGHVPNIPKEMGWASEWRYNREAFVRKTAIAVGVTALVVVAWKMRSRRA